MNDPSEKYDLTEKISQVGDVTLQNNNNAMGKLNATNIKSAIIYAILTAVAAMLAYIIGLGDIFAISIKPLVNIGVLSLAVGILSIIKNLLTTDEGRFLGTVKVAGEK